VAIVNSNDVHADDDDWPYSTVSNDRSVLNKWPDRRSAACYSHRIQINQYYSVD
jgi:hypothetical protein